MNLFESKAESPTTQTSIITLKNHQKPFPLKKTVDESIAIGLISLADGIKKVCESHCQKHGITTMQYLVMLHLAGDPNIGYAETDKLPQIVASDLAEVLNVSRPNITNLLNVLTEKKLIQQTRAKADWRKKLLVLTEEGWALIEKLQPLRFRANQRLLAHLTEVEKMAFWDSINICLDLLEPKND